MKAAFKERARRLLAQIRIFFHPWQECQQVCKGYLALHTFYAHHVIGSKSNPITLSQWAIILPTPTSSSGESSLGTTTCLMFLNTSTVKLIANASGLSEPTSQRLMWSLDQSAWYQGALNHRYFWSIWIVEDARRIKTVWIRPRGLAMSCLK